MGRVISFLKYFRKVVVQIQKYPSDPLCSIHTVTYRQCITGCAMVASLWGGLGSVEWPTMIQDLELHYSYTENGCRPRCSNQAAAMRLPLCPGSCCWDRFRPGSYEPNVLRGSKKDLVESMVWLQMTTPPPVPRYRHLMTLSRRRNNTILLIHWLEFIFQCDVLTGWIPMTFCVHGHRRYTK